MPVDDVQRPVGTWPLDVSFDEIFEQHYPRVYAVALRVTGSPEDAEEIALDVFVRLYRQPADRWDEDRLGGWLYRTALNASFNAVRSRRRRLDWLRKLANLQWAEPPAATGPAEQVERREEIERVRKGLSRLPEKQRNALVLRSHGFRYAEIAATLDIATSSVGTTLARGERALRRQLEDEVRD